MKNNNLPDGFKMTELGLLPKEWDVVRLGEVFDLKQGKQLSSKESTVNKIKKPFLRTSNISWGRVTTNKVDEMFFTPEDYEKLKLKYNDVLVCEGGDVGRTALYRGELKECAYQNHIHRLRPKDENVSPEFFVDWMIFAFTIKKMYIHTANRTTIPNLSGSRLKNFDIPLPPLPEQKKIAAVLSAVQEAKEKTEEVIKAAKELKKSLMKHLFSYGVCRVEELGSVRVKETEIGMIPEEWEVVRLGEVCHIFSGYAFRSSDFVENGVLVIKIGNLQNGTIIIDKRTKYFPPTKINENVRRFIVRENDILIALTGATIGKVSVVPKKFENSLLNQRVGKFDIISDKLENRYFRYCAITKSFQERVLGSILKSAQGNVSPKQIENIKIPLPPLPVQQKIAEILSAVDEKIQAEENKKKALEDLFKTLLNNLMTAKIRVNELNLNINQADI